MRVMLGGPTFREAARFLLICIRAYDGHMSSRDARTIVLTLAALLIVLAAYGAYLVLKGPEETSGGGTASQYLRTMSAEDLAACKGVPAPRPTPPDIGPDLYYLDQIHDALSAEVQQRGGEFVAMGTDELRKMIVIGAPHPTKAMCDDLHARYGPWIEVEQNLGIVPAN